MALVAETAVPTAVVADMNSGSSSAVSWAAVIGGALAAVAITLLLVALGSGIGLSSVSPWTAANPSARTFTLLAAVWLIIVQWLSSATGGYLVRRLQDAPSVPCPCGVSTRPLTGADNAVCNLHVTFITDSVKHYHRECTEVYYILEGQGKMELNDEVIDVEPNMIIYIEPYTRHRLRSADGVRTIVFGVPAYRQDDEFFDT